MLTSLRVLTSLAIVMLKSLGMLTSLVMFTSLGVLTSLVMFEQSKHLESLERSQSSEKHIVSYQLRHYETK